MAKIHQISGSSCICCEEKLGTDYVYLHKTRRQTHILCSECAEGYLLPILTQRIHNIKNGMGIINITVKCPGTYCGLARNKCTHMVNLYDVFVTYISDIMRSITTLLVLNNDPNLMLCPNYTCSSMFVKNTACKYLKCAKCLTEWCGYCMTQPYHKGMSCLEYKLLNSDSEDSKYMNELIREGKLKFCPVCKTATTKEKDIHGYDVGCNKISCTVCGEKWCWLCQEVGISYDHFNMESTNPCSSKLWEGVNLP